MISKGQPALCRWDLSPKQSSLQIQQSVDSSAAGWGGLEDLDLDGVLDSATAAPPGPASGIAAPTLPKALLKACTLFETQSYQISSARES